MLKRENLLYLIIILFAAIYCSISLVNHFNFRTSALDLGMFNHALYAFAHLKIPVFMLTHNGTELNYFADHFSPITILYSPFYYIFGSYTLLLIQVTAIIFGGIGIYKTARQLYPDSYLPLFFLIHFYSLWGIYSCLSFDFHNNVVAAMLVPWLIYYWNKDNKTRVVICFVLMLLAKENIALWLAFIIGALVLKNYKSSKHQRLFQLSLLLISIAYFIFVMKIAMPMISGGQSLIQLNRYSELGTSFPEIAKTIITKPLFVFSLLFENNTGVQLYDGIKLELHLIILFSGGLALIFSPYFLLMLAPIYLQKLLSNDPVLWGINIQYSIEFAPIISLSLIYSLQKLKPLISHVLIVITILTTCFYTVKTINNRKSIWYDKLNSAFYLKEHYQSDLNISEIHTALKKIPSNATLCVSSSLAPHLAFRDRIYLFPNIRDAEYIVLLNNGATYPLDKKNYMLEIQKIDSLDAFVQVHQSKDLAIYKTNNN